MLTRVRRLAIDSSRNASAWALRKIASDQTEEIAGRSCLVLAPHPDDESLGCGGTIALKRAQGTEVTIVIATSGGSGQPTELISPEDLAEVRHAEVLRACSILGVPEERMVFWGYPTKQLGQNADEAVKRLIELIETHRPDEVYVSSALDDNRDHRALNRIALRATSQSGTQTRLMEYPVWFWVTMPWFPHIRTPEAKLGRAVVQPVSTLSTLHPVGVDTTEVLSLKREAVQAHRSQVRGLDDDPRWKRLPQSLLDRVLFPQELLFPAAQRSKYLVDARVTDDTEMST